MSQKPKFLLIISLALIALVFMAAGTAAYRQFDRDLLQSELANQRKMARIVNQSMNRYFETLRFITENAVLNPSYDPARSAKEDAARYKKVSPAAAGVLLRENGVNAMLSAPRAGAPVEGASGPVENWKIFKGLPETDSAGRVIAKDRRTVARNILKSFKDIHYVFEMDTNGDLVFLEPFDTQKNVTSFNYEFRDYLRLVKASRATAISEGYISHDPNRTQVITVASPIFDETNKVAKLFAASVSAATLRERVFRSLAENLDVQDGTIFYLVDRHGHVVASSNGKNNYFPIEGKTHDGEDRGNLRETGFFKEIEWMPDVLEKGNVWERQTKSWQMSSLKPDFSGRYVNLNGVEVFATFIPTPILGSESTNWGILIEEPVSRFLTSKRALRAVFLLSGALLVLILSALSIYTLKNFSELERQVRLKEHDLARIGSQVAHDIRSPLAALDSVLASVARLPEAERLLIRSAVGRIRDIANDLLDKNQAAAAPPPPPAADAGAREASPQLLSSLIESLVTEKRLQTRSRADIEIEVVRDAASYGLFSRVEPVEFGRVLSNLINNAVESLGSGSGVVRVKAHAADELVRVSVMDDGQGIPSEILPRLGRRGATHGKAGGSGLGLAHARACAEAWGGRLEISSEVGKGTTVSLVLPRSPAPAWFVSELVLTPETVVVVLDDDESIHRVWERRFESAGAAAVRMIHFTRPEEIRLWSAAGNAEGARTLFLLDYELLGRRETGLSLAEELGLGKDSILVTSRYAEPMVLEGCRRLGARVIPKRLAAFVPIRLAAEPSLQAA